MKQYKYQLKKGGKKIKCPQCGYYTFVPFVHSSDNTTIVGDKYGRCERINSCSYFVHPNKNMDDFEPAKQIFEPELPTDFIPESIVKRTFQRIEDNTFFNFLVYNSSFEQAKELQIKYNIGTTPAGGTIFWQQDKEGNYRTGKVIHYRSNGKRSKQQLPYYLHFQFKKEFNLKQVFYGENLVNKDTPIALCESEKTAIIMSLIKPQYTWIAAGGSEMLNTYRLTRLPRLDYVCPDHGQFYKWREKTKVFNPIMDITVENEVCLGRLPEGSDILDYYLQINNNE